MSTCVLCVCLYIYICICVALKPIILLNLFYLISNLLSIFYMLNVSRCTITHNLTVSM